MSLGKAIDPKVLASADAMGGSLLFSTFEDGFGYFTDAAVSRSLKQYLTFLVSTAIDH
jgi:serine/threonine-protein kinase SRPK3